MKSTYLCIAVTRGAVVALFPAVVTTESFGRCVANLVGA
jgi:hypothetical protein